MPAPRRVQTRAAMRVQIDAVVPLGDRSPDQVIELLTHEITWAFDAEAVSVQEVAL
ncbi:MAG: hypothetical protein QM658_14245 [Gordonia sp. (in: high G+C Gram-positive bacteria)]